MLTASFSDIKPNLPGIAEQQLGQRHCPQVSVDIFINRFPEKVVWGSGYSETRRAAIVLELRKESLKSSSVCAANFYSVSRTCPFLVIYSLVSPPAPQGLFSCSTTYRTRRRGWGVATVTVPHPVFLKSFPGKCQRALFVSVTCTYTLSSPGACQGLLAFVTNAHQMPRPALSSCCHSQLAPVV